jgi:glycosyltransferase involved in cell wall biosynthesis
MPKISVITVCFNAEKYIEQTINSVIEQKDCDIEYIVIDGASTDKTLSIIKTYDSKITTWISEPDKGIADAMNKGVALATGDYLIFLNADDYFQKTDAIAVATSYMLEEKDIYIYDTIFLKKTGGIRRHSGAFGKRINFKGICHQGVLCKRSLFKKIGAFNTSFKICMDYDFFMRAYRYGATGQYVNAVLSVMRDGGISSRQDWSSLNQRFAEEKRVHLENNSSVFMKGIYAVYWALYLPYRKVLFDVKSAVSREQ